MTDDERKLLDQLEGELAETVTFDSGDGPESVVLERIEEALENFETEEAKREAFEALLEEALVEHLIPDSSGLIEVFPQFGAEIGRVRSRLELPTVKVTAFPGGGGSKPGGETPAEVMKETMQPGERYAVGEEVARGGMGAIRMGRDKTLMREVAIKSMLQFGPEVQLDHRDLARFIEEAQVTGQLEHPGIVPVYELGLDDDDRIFYTMKFVRGKTLQSILLGIRTGDAELIEEFPLHRLVQLFYRVCDAVAFAHSKGVVHRDLKPANLMIGEFGEVFVMDWGLAKILGLREKETELAEQAQTVESIRTAEGSGEWKTIAGQVGGTPEYMSPEQARGESHRIDSRTDIYALGAILYSILTLHSPIRGTSVMEKLKKVDRGEIDEPKNFEDSVKLVHCPGGRIPEALAAVALRAMAREPDDRYRSVKRLQGEIDAYERGFATRAEDAGIWTLLRLFVRRHRVAFAFVAAIFGLMVASLFVFREQKNQAVAARYKAEQLSAFLEADQVTRLLDAGKVHEAVPYLASQLRRDPTNSIAAQRLLHILTHGNFALPVTKALTHQSRMTRAVFSPDGDSLFTSSAAKYDSRLVEWDWRTARMIRSMRHGEAIRWLDLTADGKFAVTPSMDGTTGIWDLESGKKAISLPTLEKGHLFRARFNPEGNLVAVTCGRQCRVWTVPDGREIEGLPKDVGNFLFDVVFSPDGRHLAFGGLGNEAYVFDTETWKQTHKFTTDHGILRLEFSHDGKLLATGDHWVVRVWDLKANAQVGGELEIKNRIRDLRFDRSDEHLLVAGHSDQAVLWNFRTNEEPIPPLDHLAGVNWAEFSPDETLIVTGSSDHTARVWNRVTGEQIFQSLLHRASISDVCFHRSGKYLATSSVDRSAIVWDIRNGSAQSISKKHSGMIRISRRVRNGNVLLNLTSGGELVWIDPRNDLKRLRLPGGDVRVTSADLHPERDLVAVAKREEDSVWLLETGREPRLVEKFDHEITAIRFSPAGDRFFVVKSSSGGAVDGQFRIFDTDSGKSIGSTLINSARGSMEFYDQFHYSWSPDGERCLLTRASEASRISSGRNARPLGNRGLSRFRRMAMKTLGSIRDGSFSHCGTLVATGTVDGTARIWNGFDGQPESPLMRHRSTINDLDFSLDDSRLLTASDDRTAIIWDPREADQLVESLPHEERVRLAEFSPDDRLVVTATQTGILRFWDAKVGQPVSPNLQVHVRSIPMLAEFDSETGFLVVTGNRGDSSLVPVLLPPEGKAVPEWLPELAENLIGERLNKDGIREIAFGEELAETCEHVRQAKVNSKFYRDWRDWFFADRDVRDPFPRFD
ncbi:MAG: protein kinase [Verrucomicrobiales bacterium]|nr:protein kinase [Verrucomicrobiales bacterium]